MSELPFHDRTDFDDAERGRLGRMDPARVTDDAGRVVWDNDAYAFLAGECPDTANPSLWRQGQLAAEQGLFEVCPGIYQVRGLDLSNMTMIEGDDGVVVIDPLISCETAAAALALYREQRGKRPVTAVIYTHSHIDHFGGVQGIVAAGEVPIVAPQGFMDAAVAENVYAGEAMNRRAVYMYGSLLPKAPNGQIGCGLGMTTSAGRVSLLAPTIDVAHTGQVEVLDGVTIEFHLTPGTEAPAEMNFLFPDHRALCMAENATHNLHNLQTLRGAVVRDARAWARYLDEAVALFADRTDVSFASHHWPTWGTERVVRYLSEQRDLYAYLHDQTLRLLNKGYTGVEIAEMIELPPQLDQAWHARGYYGSVSHNVKAVYARYMGWFDGDPARLWPHPPEARATRYVECMGGIDAVVAAAGRYADDGDLRFATELLDHALFADPGHAGARDAQIDVFTRLGFGAENATWRNFFLTGAKELRDGVPNLPSIMSRTGGVADALTPEHIFDSIAVRIDGPKAFDEQLTIDWTFTDLDERWRTTLEHAVLTPRRDPPSDPPADVSLRLARSSLLTLLAGDLTGIEIEGDAGVLLRLAAVVDDTDPRFPIVTP